MILNKQYSSMKYVKSALLSIFATLVISACSSVNAAEEKMWHDFEIYIGAYNTGDSTTLLEYTCGPIHEFVQQELDQGKTVISDTPLERKDFSVKSFTEQESILIDGEEADERGGLVLRLVDEKWKVCDSIPIR